MADTSFIEQCKLRYREGEIIFRRGEMGNKMYVVLSGRVRLYSDTECKGAHFEEPAKGDFFGEGSLLEAISRTHSAMAFEDTELIAINRGTFLRMIRQNPEVSIKLMQRLSQRNRELGQQLGEKSGSAKREDALPDARLVSLTTGKIYPVRAKSNSVGRFDPSTGVHPDVDLTEEDVQLSVSRRHCRIIFEHERFFLLEENGVTNGTFLRGERVPAGEPREINHGDRVGFGMVGLTFLRSNT